MGVNYLQCRYLRRSGEQCTAEVAGDEYSEIQLCSKHLARAMELIDRRRSEATGRLAVRRGARRRA